MDCLECSSDALLCQARIAIQQREAVANAARGSMLAQTHARNSPAWTDFIDERVKCVMRPNIDLRHKTNFLEYKCGPFYEFTKKREKVPLPKCGTDKQIFMQDDWLC
jgi:hypothetical protein